MSAGVCKNFNSYSSHLAYGISTLTAEHVPVTLIKNPSYHLFAAETIGGNPGAVAINTAETNGHMNIRGSSWFHGTGDGLRNKILSGDSHDIVGLKHAGRSNTLFMAGNVNSLTVHQLMGYNNQGNTNNYPWNWDGNAGRPKNNPYLIPGM